MANGRQVGKQNVAAFDTWVATQSDEDFTQIVFQGKLNRMEVAKAVGCGKSALNQNPELRNKLEILEESLRDRKVLPPLHDKAKNQKEKPKEYNHNATQHSLNARRVSLLEQENIELKARIVELESHLERYGELSEALSEIGVMPC
jgi:hypothetical protein